MDIHAKAEHLHEWSAGLTRSRWDYDSPDYTIDDMLAAGERLFTRLDDRLRASDLVYVTDALNKRATFVINHVDKLNHSVAWDIDVRHDERTLLAQGESYAIRNRGPRNGRFVITDSAGKVIARDLMSRAEADERLASMQQSEAA